MGDHPSATGLYAAIVTALYRREKTGRGGVVQFVAAAERPVGQRLLRADAPVRRAGAAPSAARTCAERARQPLSLPRRPLVHHGAVQRGAAVAPVPERDRPRGSGGRSALRHASEARKQNAAALVVELDAVFATRDMAEWRTILDGVGVTFGVVGKIDDVADDAQMQAIGALVPFADGKTLTVSSPFHLDGEAKVAPRRAPCGRPAQRELCCTRRAIRQTISAACGNWACWRRLAQVTTTVEPLVFVEKSGENCSGRSTCLEVRVSAAADGSLPKLSKITPLLRSAVVNPANVTEAIASPGSSSVQRKAGEARCTLTILEFEEEILVRSQIVTASPA